MLYGQALHNAGVLSTGQASMLFDCMCMILAGSAAQGQGARFLPSWATQACGCVPYVKVQLRQLCAHKAHLCGAWLWVRPSYLMCSQTSDAYTSLSAYGRMACCFHTVNG